MIYRENDEEFLIIRQHDHALLAAELLRAVGNRMFSSPVPLAPVQLAVAQHDCAWPMYDDQPTIRDGKPRHVFEMPMETAMSIWQESVDRVAAQDPYAGLLVSLHVMALAANAAQHHQNPSRQEAFVSNRFFHRQIETQENLRRKLGMRIDLPLRRGLAEPGRSPEEDLLRANFFLLQWMDQISLVLCFDRLVIGGAQPVYPRPGGEPREAHIEPVNDAAFRVEPWPFDRDRIDLQIPVRRIPAREYADDADLRAALASAKMESTTAVLLRRAIA
jgi:hypothetical protein